MAEPDSTERAEQGSEEKLYTLSEISQRTGISMPTLQRYKKTYQSRIPSVGVGRKQRYPENALPVFDQLRSENAGKRGRPRKDRKEAAAGTRRAGRSASAGASRGVAGRGRRAARATGAAGSPARRAAGRRAAGLAGRRGARPEAARAGRGGAGRGRRTVAAAARRGAGRPAARAPRSGSPRGRMSERGRLLTLTQVSEMTGISYPTLVRYVRLYSDRLPHEGQGRSRRFYPEAVEVFRTLRQQSGRGGRRKGSGRAASGRGAGGREEGLSRQVKSLEKSQQVLEKKFRALVKSLQQLFR